MKKFLKLYFNSGLSQSSLVERVLRAIARQPAPRRISVRDPDFDPNQFYRQLPRTTETVVIEGRANHEQ